MFERVATEKIIQSGEMVILDIGAVAKGYTGDLGRTVICGDPTDEQRVRGRDDRNPQDQVTDARSGVTAPPRAGATLTSP